MNATRLLFATILLSACARERPVRVENRNLGIVAAFPGQPRLHKYVEPTPFGEIEWFSTTYETPGRLDRSFFVEVGNLPRGSEGGTTVPEILGSLRGFLTRKLGPLETSELPASDGPGFHYRVRLPNGGVTEGIAVLRRGRIHRAQATVAKAGDAQAATFLASFSVLP